MTLNTVVTVHRFAEITGIDTVRSADMLKCLCDFGVLRKQLALRCSDCGLIVQIAGDIYAFDSKVYCYKCETAFDYTSEDLEVIYTIAEEH